MAYVTVNKRSKKEQKEFYSGQRRTWGDFCPVTRTVPSGRAYKRSKEKSVLRKEEKL